METFSFSPPINVSDEGKRLIAVTFFEVTKPVFNKTNKNKTFSITTPSHWSSRGVAETINKLQKLLELISQKHTELHVEEIRKRRNQIKVGDKDYKLTDLDTGKNEIIKEVKNVENNHFEDMVFRMGFVYSKIENILDTKFDAALSTGYTLPREMYQNSDINLMIMFFPPNDVKVDITTDDIRLRSELSINKTIRFPKKILRYNTKFLLKVILKVSFKNTRFLWK